MALRHAPQLPTADELLFSVRRLGIVMQPQEGNALEAEGVTNPAAARGADGGLYLFPRLIASGNYSRIGVARVVFDANGDPSGVERLGVAIEPTEPYEKNPFSGGGCEDPRITFLEPFGRYVMTYTAFSAKGPRIALASSSDLVSWERHGLVEFSPTEQIDFNGTDNKDAVLFPTLLTDPHDGVLSIGVVHRPLVPGRPSRLMDSEMPAVASFVRERGDARKMRLRHQSMWISYCNEPQRLEQLVNLHSHHRLMSPRASWERAKVGAGCPPILTRLGWLLIYHGVAGHEGAHRFLRYSAGIVMLDPHRPERILYRSRHPIYDPVDEPLATLPHRIVFPTAVDQRIDLGDPDRIDFYYGVADSSIGVATLRLPAALPERYESPDDLRDAPGHGAEL